MILPQQNINMIAELTSIPIDILTTLLQNWLVLKEIVLLDTALCNMKLRKNFLDALLSLKIIDQPKNWFPTCEYFGWMIQKNIPIRYIYVQNVATNVHGCVFRKSKSVYQIMKWCFGLEIEFLAKLLLRVLPTCSKDLESLSVSTVDLYNGLTPAVLEAISTCTNLHTLHLTYHRAPDVPYMEPVTTIWQQCQLLEDLQLSGCMFTERDALTVSSRLKIFSFSGSGYTKITRQTLTILIARCNALRELDVRQWGYLDAMSVQLFNAPMYTHIAQHLPQLQRLGIVTYDNSFIGMEVLMNSCQYLQQVTLSRCTELDVDIFTALILHLSLTHLELYHNRTITGALDPSVLNANSTSNRSRLQHLTMQGFVGLNTAGLQSMLACCPDLKYLSLHYCYQLSFDVVEMLVEHYPSLAFVDLWNCPRLRREEVWPRLQLLNTTISFQLGATVYAR